MTTTAPTSAPCRSPRWGVLGWVATTAVVVLVAVGAAISWRTPWLLVPAVVVAGAAAALARDRTGPVAETLGVVTIVATGVVCAPEPGNVGWFAVCLVVGWSAVKGGVRPAVVLGLAGIATIAVASATVPGESWASWGGWYGGTVFTAVVTPLAHHQRVLYDRLSAAQADLADAAAARERAQIARELHDVIGHALTVSLLHVTSARVALADDPAEADAALAEAERLGQQSLAEVRQAVGLLRSDDPAARRPLPGAGELDELVAGFRRAGTRLDWTQDGDLSGLGAATGLTVYRVLQEALTNAARHAPGAPVRARLAVDAAGAVLDVRSGGPPADDAADGSGVAGMRERATALGGTLDAGPVADGWRVRAVLPTVGA